MTSEHGIFHEQPLTAIKPEGWLRQSLERFRDGLTGHLEAAGYPFDTVSWHGDESANRCSFVWEPYEQTAYWVDGMLRCAILLRDEPLRDKAMRSVGHMLDHQREDGYLGPESMRRLTRERLEDTGRLAEYKRRWRWPHAVFFRALMALNSDRRAAAAMVRHYRGDTAYEYGRGRDIINLEAALWAAAACDDSGLREQALQWYRDFNANYPDNHSTLRFMLSDQRDNQHGVTFNEMAKLGAICFLHAGDMQALRAAENAYRKLDRDQMLVDGIPSSTEHLRGKDPLDGHETCDIADYIWSVGYLLLATGDSRYGDQIERALFNAGYGAITPDAKALQYFSGPNQFICDRYSNHNEQFRGRAHMSYRPNPGTPCCPGDVNRIVPGFASRMWLTADDGGLVAALHSPSTFSGRVGRENTEIKVSQTRNYPFDEALRYEFSMQEPTEFTFRIRVPGWCDSPVLRINGAETAAPPLSGSFAAVRRTFKDGDVIELELPMTCRLTRWPRGGVAIERGPLVYALPIEEEWQRDTLDTRSTDDLPAWNIYPAGAWNYGLAVDEERLAAQATFARRPVAAEAYPWTVENAPVSIEIPARFLEGWDLAQCEHVERTIGDGDGNEALATEEQGQFAMTPQLPPVEQRCDMLGDRTKIRLLPYGCTQLRMTVFPDLMPCGK